MEVQKEAFEFLSQNSEGILATLERGQPFTSSVGYLYESTPQGLGRILILMSDLARHTKNAEKETPVSFHVLEKGTAPVYERKRISAQGIIHRINDQNRFEKYKKNYLQQFPGAALFFTLSDFHFFEIQIEELYLIAGFGKIHSLKP